MSSALVHALNTIDQGSPHVINTSPVTAFLRSVDPLDGLMRVLGVGQAYAASLGLSSIWETNSTHSSTPPQGSEFALGNNYNGGGFTCSQTGSGATARSVCSDGRTTFPAYISVKNQFGQALDPNFKNSNGAAITAFGRLKTATMMTCTISRLLTTLDTDGLPRVGALTLNFPADTTNAVYSTCGVPTTFAGRSASGTVTAVSGANFTKKLVLNLGESSPVVWLKLDVAGGIMNFMFVEDQAGSGRNAVSRTIIMMSGTNTPNTKVLFEYASTGYNASRNGGASCYTAGTPSYWSCSFEFHRGVIDQASNVAYLVSSTGDPGDATGGPGAPSKYVQYTAASRPVELAACTSSSCSERIALSVGVAGQVNADGSAANKPDDYNGCVSAIDRAVVTDNSLNCSLPGTSVASGSSTGVIELSRQFYARSTSGIPDFLTGTSENTTLSFAGASDIYTRAASQ
jgi:hypothetical protein